MSILPVMDNLIKSVIPATNPFFDTYVEIMATANGIFTKNRVCVSHGSEHAFQVFVHAYNILKYEDLDENTKHLILLASMLHDIDDRKFFTNGKDYENAKSILRNYLSRENIDVVLKMIKYVSSSTYGDTIPIDAINSSWMLIPRYADRVEAIGKIGIVRCFQYTNTVKRPLFTERTETANDEDHLWSYVATKERYDTYNGNSESMIDHFYDKLLRLGNAIPTINPYLYKIVYERKKEMVKVVLWFSKVKNEDDLKRYIIKNYIEKQE
jgi:uncharacterized protein